MDNIVVNILVPKSLYLSMNIPVGQIPSVRVAGSESMHINILKRAVKFPSKSNLHLLQPIESHCSIYFKASINCSHHSVASWANNHNDWNLFYLFWLEFH